MLRLFALVAETPVGSLKIEGEKLRIRLGTEIKSVG